MDQIHQKNF